GLQTRDFVYVSDVVDCLEAAMGAATVEAGAQCYCVCTGVETTILALAKKMADIVGHPNSISFLAARAGDIRRSVGDPRIMVGALRVAPNTNIDTGLA